MSKKQEVLTNKSIADNIIISGQELTWYPTIVELKIKKALGDMWHVYDPIQKEMPINEYDLNIAICLVPHRTSASYTKHCKLQASLFDMYDIVRAVAKDPCYYGTTLSKDALDIISKVEGGNA